MRGWLALLLVILAVMWMLLTWGLTVQEYLSCTVLVKPCRFLFSYGWVTFIGGLTVGWAFVEFNRFLFARDSLRPYRFAKSGYLPRNASRVPLQEIVQYRCGPRVEPMVLGLIERTLFFFLTFILLEVNAVGATANLAVLVAPAGGYVVLKSVKRVQADLCNRLLMLPFNRYGEQRLI